MKTGSTSSRSHKRMTRLGKRMDTDCGLITDRVRVEIGELALRHPGVIFAADSRTRIGLFQHVVVKPNAWEATLAVRPDWSGEVKLELARESGAELFRGTASRCS